MISALSSAEAPAGYPNKNSNRKRAEDDRKREKALLSFPFPSCPAHFLFLSPNLPATQRGLCGGEINICDTVPT